MPRMPVKQDGKYRFEDVFFMQSDRDSLVLEAFSDIEQSSEKDLNDEYREICNFIKGKEEFLNMRVRDLVIDINSWSDMIGITFKRYLSDQESDALYAADLARYATEMDEYRRKLDEFKLISMDLDKKLVDERIAKMEAELAALKAKHNG